MPNIFIKPVKPLATNIIWSFIQSKKQCDAYFWNAHRNEARGIGGLFFDYLKATENQSMEDWFNFVTEVGNSFLEAYVPIVEKRKDLPYTARKELGKKSVVVVM
jgi:coproporphyrinogen III oxidase